MRLAKAADEVLIKVSAAGVNTDEINTRLLGVPSSVDCVPRIFSMKRMTSS